VANSYIKAPKIAAMALGVLEREIVLPALVWRDAGGSFKGAQGDTITIRVPARSTARVRQLRANRTADFNGAGIITLDDLAETSVDVTLDQEIYHGTRITDEELTLDITDFGTQVLLPQVRAVAEGLENKLAELMVGATYATTVSIPSSGDDVVYDAMIDARKALNIANVPTNERVVVMGPSMEARFLKDNHLNHADTAGDASALRDATIGRIAGFGQVVVSNALPEDVGFAFHRTAYVLSTQAPAVPDGAPYGASQSYQGLAMRWLRDYDPGNLQDRSILGTYAGANIIADGPKGAEVQTATITGSPTGGSFTLTYAGQTTAAIAYNASAATVRDRLRALNNLDNDDVTVTGSAGGPYTITIAGKGNVGQITATASLTGGSSPGVTMATSTEGGLGDPSFVRAVKLVLS
jgi:hypothetical protein